MIKRNRFDCSIDNFIKLFFYMYINTHIRFILIICMYVCIVYFIIPVQLICIFLLYKYNFILQSKKKERKKITYLFTPTWRNKSKNNTLRS